MCNFFGVDYVYGCSGHIQMFRYEVDNWKFFYEVELVYVFGIGIYKCN